MLNWPCTFFIMSHYMTGGDRKLFGDASYQLGLAFINNGDPQTALTVQNFMSSILYNCCLLLPLLMLDISLLFAARRLARQQLVFFSQYLFIGGLVGWFRPYISRQRISAVTEQIIMKFSHKFDVESGLKTYFRNFFSPHLKNMAR